MSDFDAILSECLERIARGEPASCLSRALPSARRRAGAGAGCCASLSRVWAPTACPNRRAPRRRPGCGVSWPSTEHPRARGGLWTQGWLRGLAGVAAVFLLVTFLGVSVAASQPGDWGYALRSAAERAPARFAPDADGRIARRVARRGASPCRSRSPRRAGSVGRRARHR